MNEIHDELKSFQRRRKQKIVDDFIIAEAIALNILNRMSPDKEKRYPKPWDYYAKLFAEEKIIHEKQEQERQFEEYKENRKLYAAEFNRRRQQGLV